MIRYTSCTFLIELPTGLVLKKKNILRQFKMKHQPFQLATVFLMAFCLILQSLQEAQGIGDSSGGRGSGGRGSGTSGGGSRYTSSSSRKSFAGKAVAFGAGAYIGHTAVKLAKTVRLGGY